MGKQITGSRSLLQAVTVPEINQIFLGGRFNDELELGNITLNSPLSNNVYVAYLKDDTWLDMSPTLLKETYIYPNPFDDYFQVLHTENLLSLDVFDSNGQKLNVHTEAVPNHHFGANWPMGLYLLKLRFVNGDHVDLKVLKVK